MTITATVETITPKLAAEWLMKNISYNRKLLNRKVDNLVSAINRGEWQMNGASIVFDENDNLIDGQNRLTAISRCTRPSVDCVVVRGVEESAYQTIDSGSPRKDADRLRELGVEHTGPTANFLQILHRHRNDVLSTIGSNSRWAMTGTQLISLYEEETEAAIEESVEKFRRGAAARLMTPRFAIFSHFAFGEIDKEKAEGFMEKVGTGIGLTPNCPCWSLRETLSQRKYKKMMPKEVLACIILAWNAFAEGRTIRDKITWNSHRDPFPAIIDKSKPIL